MKAVTAEIDDTLVTVMMSKGLDITKLPQGKREWDVSPLVGDQSSTPGCFREGEAARPFDRGEKAIACSFEMESTVSEHGVSPLD